MGNIFQRSYLTTNFSFQRVKFAELTIFLLDYNLTNGEAIPDLIMS